MSEPAGPTFGEPTGATDDESRLQLADAGGVTLTAGHEVGVHLMTLDSVPDGRSSVPSVWWVPVVALVVLGMTTTLVVGAELSLGFIVAVLATSAIGYFAVLLRIRPAPLRSTRRSASPPQTPGEVHEVTATGRPLSRMRSAWLLLASASVGLGLFALWSFVVSQLVPPPDLVVIEGISPLDGFLLAVSDSVGTSVLEECGVALVMLAVAGTASRVTGLANNPRLLAVVAITAGAVLRTLLHIPLWGPSAIARIGLAVAFAWLFWRTRRIWPLVVAHILWDTLALLTLLSPSVPTNNLAAFLILVWALTGSATGLIACGRSWRTRPATTGQRGVDQSGAQ